MSKSPCMGCPGRSPYCHTTCSRYIFFRKAADREMDERQRKKEKMLVHRDIEYKRYKRMSCLFGQL